MLNSLRLTLRSFLMLSSLTLPLPDFRASARPPEGITGRMALDRVGAGLDCYARAKDSNRRLWWLKRLAPTRDPRVAIALAELMRVGADTDRIAAARLLYSYYKDPTELGAADLLEHYMEEWWGRRGPELRRRANEYPP